MFPGFTWEMFKQECKYKHPRRCEYGGNAECYNGNVVSANTKMIGQIKIKILWKGALARRLSFFHLTYIQTHKANWGSMLPKNTSNQNVSSALCALSMYKSLFSRFDKLELKKTSINIKNISDQDKDDLKIRLSTILDGVWS